MREAALELFGERGYARVTAAEVAEARCPGSLGRLLTHPVRGLGGYEEMIRLLTGEKGAIKMFVEVKSDS